VSAQVIIYGSATALTEARQDYASTVAPVPCHCQGVAVGTQSVTGVGDQATAQFITVSPDATFASLSDTASPGIVLFVRSSNALIILSENTSTISGTPVEPQADAAQLRPLTAMARSIMATLAQPAGASSAPIGPAVYGPNYAGRRDACRLITATTLARYAPDASVIPLPNAVGTARAATRTSTCSWGTGTSTTILLTLNLFHGASSALQQFNTDTQSLSQSVSGTTVTGARWVSGVGSETGVIFETQNGAPIVEMLVLSGNAELEYSYHGPGGPVPTRATLLAGGIAIARDALAALASPAASSVPQGTVYASPHDPCTLIKTSTLASYLPGVTETQNPGGAAGQPASAPNMQESQCFFTAGGLTGTQLALFATIYDGPDDALSGFESGVQLTRQQPEVTYEGQQPVNDLGQQATAIFQNAAGASTANLYVLSGNSVLELIFDDAPFGGPQMSRATLLADDIVMAREALASLPVKQPAG
jgi:hypothetical protein